MFHRTGSIEINCDAPLYQIVQACQEIGIHSPEDVRWCRMSHFVKERQSRGFLAHQPWKFFFGGSRPQEIPCSCGQKLPLLEKCTFTFLSGNLATFLLGQCPRCRT
ncbi:MAG: hypothetical protein JO112_01335, partial [Planctomycetes bacterium]|nr:hypothetical protein [Planctomycetota bacterium]